MTLSASARITADRSLPQPGPLASHAEVVRALGSTFVPAVLEATERQLHHAPRTAALIAAWPRDVAADALAMRVNAALHALARSEAIPALTALYRTQRGDFDAAIGEALAQGDAMIVDWLRDPPQTNEVGRTASIVAALMVARRRFDMPCELLELGASAGLALNLDRYAYTLGGREIGCPGSPVRVAPDWHGPPPPVRPIAIRSARGVDLRPVDIADPAARARLMAFIWADQQERLQRLSAAIAIALARPPQVDQGDITTWLPARLALPQAERCCRVVVHSMALQYLDPVGRRAVEAAFRDAGVRADAHRPLARIAFEWTAARDAVHLSLTLWPDGSTQHLATCHAYGAWVEWHGPSD